MNSSNVLKIVAVLAVIAAVVVVVIRKNADVTNDTGPGSTTVAHTSTETTTPADASPEQTAPLPRLVDLGRNKCIPCKKMAPILDKLAEDFDGRFIVEVINLENDREAAKRYNVKLVPTQIFFDLNGIELSRHEGFLSREDILATWKTHGYEFTGDDDAGTPTVTDGNPDRVIAYYFHADIRCITCLVIEEQARDAIAEAFPMQLESGELEWLPVNFEQAENVHFEEDYELSTSSLVLVRFEGGKQKNWKTLERVWELVDFIDEFEQYVNTETRDFMAFGS